MCVYNWRPLSLLANCLDEIEDISFLLPLIIALMETEVYLLSTNCLQQISYILSMNRLDQMDQMGDILGGGKRPRLEEGDAV